MIFAVCCSLRKLLDYYDYFGLSESVVTLEIRTVHQLRIRSTSLIARRNGVPPSTEVRRGHIDGAVI